MSPHEILEAKIFLYEWGGVLGLFYGLLLVNAFRYSFVLPAPKSWAGAWPTLFIIAAWIRIWPSGNYYDPFEEDYKPAPDFFEALNEDMAEVVMLLAGFFL